MMKRIWVSAVLGFGLLGAPGVQAQTALPNGDMLYVMPVSPAPEPWYVAGRAQTCLTETSACQTAVAAVADQFGLPLDTVAQMSNAAAQMGWETSLRIVDEQYWQRFEQPDGYALCNLYTSTLSTRPDQGENAAYMSIRADQTRVSVYNFVHAGGDAGYEGVVVVHLTPTSSADDGHCSLQPAAGKQATYACQGSVDFGGEYPPCASAPLKVSP